MQIKRINAGTESVGGLEQAHYNAGPPSVDFAYSTARIKNICERRVCAVAELGEPATLELGRRLADIDACDTAADFVALYGGELLSLSGHRWALCLVEDIKMQLVAAHVKVPLTKTGATDWTKVTKFRIETIGGKND